MTATDVPAVRAGEEWFLARGMPAVLTHQGRLHAIVRRSAPALAAWAVLMVLNLYVLIASGDQDIDITDAPTLADWSVLVVLAVMLPAMAAAAYAVARVPSARARQLIAYACIVAGLASDTYEDGVWDLLAIEATDVVVVLLILAGTASGLGALLSWALRVTFDHLRSAGQLMARALPVVLLTFLVFFNSTVWFIAANLETFRIWQLAGCLAAIAIAFVGTESVHVTRSLLARPAEAVDQPPTVETTPLAGIPEPQHVEPLRRSERVNVVAVAVLAQSIQVLVISLVTGFLFFVMGLVILNGAVLNHLTDASPTQSRWLDIPLPIDQALVHMTIILVAMTFMYLSARVAADPAHRTDFVDPMLDDLRLTLTARDRYRSLV